MIDFLLNREFNPKCIAISGLAVALFWTNLPQQTVGLSAGLAVAAYVVLAWADQTCGCGAEDPPVGLDE
jgi:hypothetical protein